MCKTRNEGKNDEIALMTHKLKNKFNKEEVFLGWIFKSTQYLNSPTIQFMISDLKNVY